MFSKMPAGLDSLCLPPFSSVVQELLSRGPYPQHLSSPQEESRVLLGISGWSKQALKTFFLHSVKTLFLELEN